MTSVTAPARREVRESSPLHPYCVANVEATSAAMHARGGREVQVDATHAADRRFAQGQPRAPEDVEHRRVVVQHEGDELADVAIARDADELAQEEARGATS
jgi:hypothetical protein